MRKVLHSGSSLFEVLEENDSVLAFRDFDHAIAFLRPFKIDPFLMAVLRNALADYSSMINPQDDEEAIRSLASLLVSGRLKILRTFEMPSGGTGGESSKPPVPAGGTTPARNLSWVEFQVLDHLTGQPIPQVSLSIQLPSGLEASDTTDPMGLIRIENVERGNCAVWCSLKDLHLGESLAFVAMGASSGKVPSSKGAERENIVRRIANIEEHSVKKGENLASLAAKAGIAWQDIARFNWDTDIPKEVNKHLHDDVGCSKKTTDGKNYVFDDSDNPGIVYIPTKWKRTGLATGTRHVIRVKFLEPFLIILENEEGLRIPEAEYEVTFADGSVRKGKLGKSGVVMIKDPPPGPVIVVYPDHEDITAKSLAALVRRSFDDRDPQELYRALKTTPEMVDRVIKMYDKYFNDYTGQGLVEDIYQEVTDPDALPAVVGLLARAGVQTHEKVEYVPWEPDEED